MNKLILTAGGVLVVVAVAGCNSGTSTTSTSKSGPAVIENTNTPTRAAASAFTPNPADFHIEVIVTGQKCFGSAGCSTEYTLDPTYTGTGAIPDGASFTIIYDIIGGDETQTGKLTVNRGQFHFDESSRIDTQEGARLTARVTRILNR